MDDQAIALHELHISSSDSNCFTELPILIAKTNVVDACITSGGSFFTELSLHVDYTNSGECCTELPFIIANTNVEEFCATSVGSLHGCGVSDHFADWNIVYMSLLAIEDVRVASPSELHDLVWELPVHVVSTNLLDVVIDFLTNLLAIQDVQLVPIVYTNLLAIEDFQVVHEGCLEFCIASGEENEDAEVHADIMPEEFLDSYICCGDANTNLEAVVPLGIIYYEDANKNLEAEHVANTNLKADIPLVTLQLVPELIDLAVHYEYGGILFRFIENEDEDEELDILPLQIIDELEEDDLLVDEEEHLLASTMLSTMHEGLHVDSIVCDDSQVQVHVAHEEADNYCGVTRAKILGSLGRLVVTAPKAFILLADIPAMNPAEMHAVARVIQHCSDTAQNAITRATAHTGICLGNEELLQIASKSLQDFSKTIAFLKGQQVLQPFACHDASVLDIATPVSSNLCVTECIVDCLNEVPTSSNSS